ncbi:hypothetical protein HWV62_34509 [Athelia sp. TMB]|nr:hypothetical protein HWV62_34509 [Athelia sp. TMB]
MAATRKAALLLLSAFTTSAHAGNPAAVILLPSDTVLTDAEMQATARDLVQPMHAFVSPPTAGTDGAYGIRWFTTEAEITMCGHATVCAAKAIWASPGYFDEVTDSDSVRFRTKSGALVSARRDGERVEITFPHAPTVSIAHDSVAGLKIRDVVAKALGTQKSGEALEIIYMGHGTGHYAEYGLVHIAETGGFKLEGTQVFTDAFKESPFLINVITSAGDGRNGESFVSRMFAPNCGAAEDQVCGSAHCLLAPYWAQKRGPLVAPSTPMSARQVSKRGGLLRVSWNQELESVTIRGDVVVWLIKRSTGELPDNNLNKLAPQQGQNDKYCSEIPEHKDTVYRDHRYIQDEEHATSGETEARTSELKMLIFPSRRFSGAQIFVISFSAILLTGVAVTFIMATTASVIWPTQVNGQSAQSTLSFRPIYLVPLAIFPAALATLQLALVIKYNAYAPTDNFHADVTGSLWICLLGYAGMPMLESIPCFGITLYAGLRVAKIHKMQSTQRSSMGLDLGAGTRTDPFAAPTPALVRMPRREDDAETDVDGWTKLPEMSPLSSHKNGRSTSSLGTSGQHAKQSSTASGGYERHHGKTPSQTSQARFHMPFRPASPQQAVSPISTVVDTVSDNKSTSAFSAFKYPTVMEEDDPFDRDIDDVENIVAQGQGHKDRSSQMIRLDSTCEPDNILVTLSTIIDIAHGRHVLTPFGTEHIALILAAWGPFVIFSHSPGVRQKLMFWT